MKILSYRRLPPAALSIRITVFVDEQGFVDEVDDTDSFAIHLLAFLDDKAIATCRIFPSSNEGEYILGRLCVLKEERGKGVGRLLVKAAEEAARGEGAKALCLHSQEHAKGFYEQIGYAVSSEIEFEQGQPHIWMKKNLEKTEND